MLSMHSRVPVRAGRHLLTIHSQRRDMVLPDLQQSARQMPLGTRLFEGPRHAS